MRGLKISLEGIDGAGKTTQTSMIQDHLRNRGHDVLFKPCRNSTFTEGVDNDILQILQQSRRELRDAPATEALLTAARMLYVHTVRLDDHLNAGGTVLCDRDIDTAVAYSMPGLKQKYPGRTTAELAGWMTAAVSIEHTMPDLTLFFDVDPGIALARAMSDEVPNERAVFDEGGVAYINEVSRHYRELHGLYPDRIHRIDVSERGIEEVGSLALGAIDTFLDQNGVYA